jgi:glucoamylase
LGDGVFGPTSKEVAGTVSTLNELFCDMFQINQDDTKNGVPGILYGRYEGDHYAGGNPWILLSSALAEVLYRGASDMLTMSTETMNVEDMAAWSKVLDVDFDGSDVAQLDPLVMAKAFAGAGNGARELLYDRATALVIAMGGTCNDCYPAWRIECACANAELSRVWPVTNTFNIN